MTDRMSEMGDMGNGLHLFIDGLSPRPLTQGDLETFLKECPREIGMSPILGPAIFQSEGGWSGIMIIAESHISVHCRGRETYVDISSCKPFDPDATEQYVVKQLQLTEVVVQSIHWGWGAREKVEDAE